MSSHLGYIALYCLTFVSCIILPKMITFAHWWSNHIDYCLNDNIVLLTGNISANLVYAMCLYGIYKKKHEDTNSKIRIILSLTILLPVVSDLVSCLGYRFECNGTTNLHLWVPLASIGIATHAIHSIFSIWYYISTNDNTPAKISVTGNDIELI